MKVAVLEPIFSWVRRVTPDKMRPIAYLTRLASRRSELTVVSGPFAGMKYLQHSIGSAYIPKLIGIYERELAGIVEEICASHPSIIVDVGAAEGYYAVGFSRRLPGARVIAYELQEIGRAALAEMADLNGVTNRIEIRGKCTVMDMRELAGSKGNPVFVVDVEGMEGELLDPIQVPGFRTSRILAELHEFVHPGITMELVRRFGNTHNINQVFQEPRKWSEFPWPTAYARALPPSYRRWAVSEWRPEQMSWLWMTPKGQQPASRGQ